MIDFLDLILAIFVRFLNLICRIMPVSLVLAIGRRVGLLLYFAGSYRRRIGYQNMRAVFCKIKTPSEIKKVLEVGQSGF